YRGAGRTAEAITVYEAVLADCERLLGPDHPDTLTICNNLGLAYGAAGRTAEAVTVLEAVLADCERLLGPDHPDTLAARHTPPPPCRCRGGCGAAGGGAHGVGGWAARLGGPPRPGPPPPAARPPQPRQRPPGRRAQHRNPGLTGRTPATGSCGRGNCSMRPDD